MNLSPIQAALALVAIGFKERELREVLRQADLDPFDPRSQGRVISEERLKLEIEEWSVRKQSTKKEQNQ